MYILRNACPCEAHELLISPAWWRSGVPGSTSHSLSASQLSPSSLVTDGASAKATPRSSCQRGSLKRGGTSVVSNGLPSPPTPCPPLFSQDVMSVCSSAARAFADHLRRTGPGLGSRCLVGLAGIARTCKARGRKAAHPTPHTATPRPEGASHRKGTSGVCCGCVGTYISMYLGR